MVMIVISSKKKKILLSVDLCHTVTQKKQFKWWGSLRQMAGWEGSDLKTGMSSLWCSFPSMFSLPLLPTPPSLPTEENPEKILVLRPLPSPRSSSPMANPSMRSAENQETEGKEWVLCCGFPHPPHSQKEPTKAARKAKYVY